MNKEKKILIASGGTGGHIIPALSLYDFLKDENYIVKEITSDTINENIDKINLNNIENEFD